MHLASYNNTTQRYDFFRDLSVEELNQHAAFTPIYAEANSRLSLFRMLDRNYAEWKTYLNRMLSSDFKQDVDYAEEVNRLLLNYLTFSYTIQEHFSVSFRQRFRKQPAEIEKYSSFLDRLCAARWPFAFILDYRGYFQHVALGVTHANRTADDTSICISITANARDLLSGSNGWKKSALKAEQGDLDLVSILREFHDQMLKSYAVFVIKTFYPELSPAADFYSRLTTEVKQRDPEARMMLITKKPDWTPDDRGKISVKLDMVLVPNDVFAELGINVEKPGIPAEVLD